MPPAAPPSRLRPLRNGRIGRRLTVFAAVLFLAMGTAAEDAAPPDAPPERAAYLALVRADDARDAGRPRDALRLYNEAAARFERLAEEHPDRIPAPALAARIAYCREQAEAIAARMAVESARASVEAAAEIERLRARVAELEAQLAEAARRIARLQQEGADARHDD